MNIDGFDRLSSSQMNMWLDLHSFTLVSYYSSVLRTTTATYCRGYTCSNSPYYYEAIKINVFTSGNYTIRSSSSIDTFGYLYNNDFDSTYPTLNMLAYNDDDTVAGTKHFKLSRWLQAMNDYILMVTTYLTSVTGPFSISVQGPALAGLSLVNATGQCRHNPIECLSDSHVNLARVAMMNRCCFFLSVSSVIAALRSVILHVSIDQQQLGLLSHWKLLKHKILSLSTDRIDDLRGWFIYYPIQR